MPRKRIMLVNTSLCGLAADNYVIMREKDGPLWVLASSRRPLMILGRVEEGFFSWPSLWFSLDRGALSERPSLSLTIFRLPREAGASPERLLRAAADLAHEALCLCNCSIVERTRHYDYWLMRLRYTFSPVPNDFGLNPLVLPPHNDRLELVNDTCVLAIYLPEGCVAHTDGRPPAYLASTGELAIGLYFRDSAAGPRGLEDAWLGDRSVGGGFYVKKGYSPGDAVVVECRFRAERLIPSMFITEVAPFVHGEYMRYALVLCAASLALLAVVGGLVVLELRRLRTAQGGLVSSTALCRLWAFYAAITSSLCLFFLWSYAYNVLKLHLLALALQSASALIASLPLLRVNREWGYRLPFTALALISLVLMTCTWSRFMPEHAVPGDCCLILVAFMGLLALAHPSFSLTLLSDSKCLLVALACAVVGTACFFALQVPELLLGVPIDMRSAPMVAIAVFLAAIASCRLAK